MARNSADGKGGPTTEGETAPAHAVGDTPKVTKHRYFITTVVAAIAAVASAGTFVLTALVNQHAIFGSDGLALSMPHDQFAKLTYSQQLDLCVPYVR